MSAFDRIIGYDAVKEELVQLCDMLHNREHYDRLGARLPHGLLIYGDPGLGKTLMAETLIEESGRRVFNVRRNISGEEFVKAISEAFGQAKANVPSIVFLDDMDKFANDDEDHCDSDEYVAVQAGIDDVKNDDVFVIATVNDMRKLPDSLTRAGRFDRKIFVDKPSEEDSERIIEHYLSGKNISRDVDITDVTKMISYSSCAELETILNEAAIRASYARKSAVEMSDIVDAVLKIQHKCDSNAFSDADAKKNAIHEAGHIVVSEVLAEGSVGLASIKVSKSFNTGGFVRTCGGDQSEEYGIMLSLAGFVASEQYYPFSEGCGSDFRNASRIIKNKITRSGSYGVGFLEVVDYDTTNEYWAAVESAVHVELERYIREVRKIIIDNSDFLEKTAKALEEKQTLVYSDIKKLRESTMYAYKADKCA